MPMLDKNTITNCTCSYWTRNTIINWRQDGHKVSKEFLTAITMYCTYIPFCVSHAIQSINFLKIYLALFNHVFPLKYSVEGYKKWDYSQKPQNLHCSSLYANDATTSMTDVWMSIQKKITSNLMILLPANENGLFCKGFSNTPYHSYCQLTCWFISWPNWPI